MQQKKNVNGLPFGKTNLRILLAALVVIVLGYIAMAQPPVDSFLSTTVAPILLLIAFLVIIPYSIFHGHRNSKQKAESGEQ